MRKSIIYKTMPVYQPLPRRIACVGSVSLHDIFFFLFLLSFPGQPVQSNSIATLRQGSGTVTLPEGRVGRTGGESGRDYRRAKKVHSYTSNPRHFRNIIDPIHRRRHRLGILHLHRLEISEEEEESLQFAISAEMKNETNH